jgi:hypothetical protein
MAKRTVVWTATAARQRREVLKYWTKHNGSTRYAEKLISITASQIQIIRNHLNQQLTRELGNLQWGILVSITN